MAAGPAVVDARDVSNGQLPRAGGAIRPLPIAPHTQ